MRAALALSAALAVAACAAARPRSAAPAVRTGLDVLEDRGFAPLKGKRVGVITNRTGIDARGRSIVDVLASAPGVTLAAVLSPEHGFTATLESGRISSSTVRAGGRDIPIVSLYLGGNAGMRPRPDQFRDFDVVIFDIQDIGARFYTYLATMGMAMEEAKKENVAFMVLDRPNPVDGVAVEGPIPDEPGLLHESSVGYFAVPTRHGLTAGEMALWHNEFVGHPDLTVVKMTGWKRGMWFDETGLPWVPPSPNMPDLEAAALYYGVANLEETNLSVGRGTPHPFGWIGAPWLNADALARRMNAAGLAGIEFSAQDETPTKSLYAGIRCRGVRLTLTDRRTVRPLRVFAHLAAGLRDLHPKDFDLHWKSPRVEAESRKLVGLSAFKTLYDRGADGARLAEAMDPPTGAFQEARRPYLLYGEATAVPLEAEIGQLFVVALDTEIAAHDEADIRAGRLGGALLRWDKFTGPQARDFSALLQTWASSAPTGLPFLVTADHEGGAVFTQPLYGGTIFPGNMALGAAGSAGLAEAAAEATARELRVLGVHVDFAPDIDVNTNPENRIIGIRSFGEDPRAVAEMGAAAVRGFLKGGVAPVVKHFPGHGASAENSHFDMPVIEKSAAELDAVELVPFRAAVKAGAPIVMPAHILFPAYEPGGLPVTLSSSVIGGLLRGKLGYQGIVASDSLDMGAITKRYGEAEAAVMALAAGCDLLVLGKVDFPPVYERVLAAVKDGRLSRARVDEAYARVAALKARFGTPPAAPVSVSSSAVVYPDAAAHAALAREIAERAVTLLRNDEGLLPLTLAADKSLLVLMFRSPRYPKEMRAFKDALTARHARTEFLETAPSPDAATVAAALKAAGKADVVLIGTSEWGPPSRLQTDTTRKLLALGKPVVLASLMNPYDLRYWPEAKTALATYGITPAAMDALARLLFGEVPPRGRLPVTVPGLYPRGAGMDRFAPKK
ncbi:MAG: glycoside hydrolase family 3 N-terminal domain-containing protein [Elusimicrobiota bacterium]